MQDKKDQLKYADIQHRLVIAKSTLIAMKKNPINTDFDIKLQERKIAAIEAEKHR